MYDISVSIMCIYRDHCVYYYKFTELVSLYSLDFRLKINIINNLAYYKIIYICNIIYPNLKRMPMKKAPGPNGVLTEMLVVAGEYGLKELTRLTHMVYNHGYFPEELNKSRFITLPKISGTTKFE